MKPYGVRIIESPDVADIKMMGSKSCIGQIRGHSGDFHPYNSGASKAHIRRYWKRVARREGDAQINEEV